MVNNRFCFFVLEEPAGREVQKADMLDQKDFTVKFKLEQWVESQRIPPSGTTTYLPWTVWTGIILLHEFTQVI